MRERQVSRRRAFGGLAAGIAGVLTLAVACGGSSGNGAGGNGTGGTAGGTRKVSVLLDWDPNPDHAALYVAKDSGYYAARGLAVSLQPPSDPSDPVKLVSVGKMDLGISYEPETIISAARGLNVVAVAALIPTALDSIVAKGSKHITTPADLAGKTLGTSGLATDDAFLDAIIAKYGMKPGSVKKVNISQDLLSAMITGDVDATLGSYRNVEGVVMKDRGLNPTIIPVTDAGVPNYDELVVVANRDKLKNDGAYQRRVRDFLAATAQGNARAVADPGALDASMRKVAKGYEPSDLPKIDGATLPLLKNPAGFGHMDIADWQSFASWMRSEKLIGSDVTASDVATNAYLPAS
jgi:putative hydroxymethylpyrimidine transport system substrate-binding protein